MGGQPPRLQRPNFCTQANYINQNLQVIERAHSEEQLSLKHMNRVQWHRSGSGRGRTAGPEGTIALSVNH